MEQCAKLLRSRNHQAAAFVTKLAVLCREQKRYDEVEPEFVKVLEFSHRILSEEHPLMLKKLAWFQATFPVAELRNGTNAIEYAFVNLRSPNGLLHWGGHVAYDAQADENVEPPSKVKVISIPEVGGLHHRYSRVA